MVLIITMLRKRKKEQVTMIIILILCFPIRIDAISCNIAGGKTGNSYGVTCVLDNGVRAKGTGYCQDSGAGLPSNLSCSTVARNNYGKHVSSQYTSIVNYPGLSEEDKAYALRMLTVYERMGSTGASSKGLTPQIYDDVVCIKFRKGELKDPYGSGLVHPSTKQPLQDFCKGRVSSNVQAAAAFRNVVYNGRRFFPSQKEQAETGEIMFGDGKQPSPSTETGKNKNNKTGTSGVLTFTEISKSANTVTVSVNSSRDVGPVDFKANGDAIQQSGGNGQWTLTLNDTNGDCAYKIEAFYCDDGEDIEENSENETPTASQKMNKTIYCSDASTNQNFVVQLTETIGDNPKPIQTCGTSNSQNVSLMSTQTANATFSGVFECGDDTCDEQVSSRDTRRNELTKECGKITSEDYAEKLMVNCCNDSTGYVSYYKMAKLTQIFCENISKKERELGLKSWDPKCGTKKEFNTKENFDGAIMDYCQEYCTYKVGIEVPGQIDGKAGMYFELKHLDGLIESNGFPAPSYPDYSSNIYSPYLMGVKRCRTRIDYQTWRNDYLKASDDAMRAFNEYQHSKAEWDLLDKTERAANAAGKQNVGNPGLECSYEISVNCKTSITTTYTDPTIPKDYDENTVSEVVDQKTEYPKIGEQQGIVYKFDNQPDINYLQIKHHTNKYPQTNFIQDVFPNGQTTYQGLDYTTENNPYSVKKNGTRPSNGCSTNDAYTGNNHISHLDVKAITDKLDAEKSSWESKPAVSYAGGQVSYNSQTAPDGSSTTVTEKNCDSGSATWKCYYDDVATSIVNQKYNMPSCKENRKGAARNASGSYDTAITKIKGLEENLNECDDKYNDIIGNPSEAEKHYAFDNPQVEFKYTQVYYDQTGTLVLHADTFPFEAAECKVNAFEDIGEDVIYNSGIPLYSDGVFRLRDHEENLKTFGEFKLQPNSSSDNSDIIKNLSEFEARYRNGGGSGYTGRKIWARDIYYVAECYWPTSEVPWRTLYPNAGDGLVSSSVVKEASSTGHTKVITTYMSVWEGSYETVWSISGLGTGGTEDNKSFDFEKRFREESSQTCSTQHVDAVKADWAATAFTCKVNITKQIVQTEGCPPIVIAPNYSSSQARNICCDGPNASDCPTLEMTIKSTIVDPEKLCPEGTNCDYIMDNFKDPTASASSDGKKWNNAYKEIVKRAEDDQTYSKERLSYTFELTPGDIKEIREDHGSYGYTGDQLTCKSPEIQDVSGEAASVASGECKSNLVHELYRKKGKVAQYDSVRTGNSVHWAWYGNTQTGENY